MKTHLDQVTFLKAWQVRAINDHQNAQRQIAIVTNAARGYWLQLQKAIGRKASKNEISAIVRELVNTTEKTIEAVLLRTAETAFDSAFEVWEKFLPAKYWTAAASINPNLLESVEFYFDEPRGPGPSGKSKEGNRSSLDGLRAKGKIPPKKPAVKPVKKAAKVPPEVAAKVKKYIRPSRKGFLAIVRSRGWKSRLRGWSSKIKNLDEVARLIAEGYEKGQSVDQIARKIRPHVQGYVSAARRIVRTETARIENQLAEKTFEAFSGVIAGYQIINPLDERTRPKHAIRAGKIFWTDGRRSPNAKDRPELPDAPNCRCRYAPILTEPTGASFASRPMTNTYAEWFNQQTDKQKRRIVGSDRWEELKKKTKRPSFYDAIDPKTGDFVDVEKLQRERPATLLSRRKKNQETAKKNTAAAKRSLRYFSPNED